MFRRQPSLCPGLRDLSTENQKDPRRRVQRVRCGEYSGCMLAWRDCACPCRSHLPESSAGVGTLSIERISIVQSGLPRFHWAGPSTSLDKSDVMQLLRGTITDGVMAVNAKKCLRFDAGIWVIVVKNAGRVCGARCGNLPAAARGRTIYPWPALVTHHQLPYRTLYDPFFT